MSLDKRRNPNDAPLGSSKKAKLDLSKRRASSEEGGSGAEGSEVKTTRTGRIVKRNSFHDEREEGEQHLRSIRYQMEMQQRSEALRKKQQEKKEKEEAAARKKETRDEAKQKEQQEKAAAKAAVMATGTLTGGLGAPKVFTGLATTGA